MYLLSLVVAAVCATVDLGQCDRINSVASTSITARQQPPSSPSNTTGTTTQVLSNTPLVKGLATSIASFVALVTAVTYFFLLYLVPSLSNGFVSPFESLERRLSTIIPSIWVANLTHGEVSDVNSIRVLRILELDQEYPVPDLDELFLGVGYEEVQRKSPDPLDQQYYRSAKQARRVWLSPASPVMKNIFLIAVWECWIFWMVVAMVLLTIVYNGFIYGQPGPDGVIRLVLISAYAVANIAHIFWSWRLLSQVLQAVANQACWNIISKMFLFSSQPGYAAAPLNSTKEPGSYFRWVSEYPVELRHFQCDILGLTKTVQLYSSGLREEPSEHHVGSNQLADIGEDKVAHLFQKVDHKTTAEDDMKPMLESEVKALEKAGESCLDRVLANVFLILGICLSTGLAPWTTVQSAESTATQIGSYSIILAIGIGAAALIAGLSHLRNAAESATILRRFQVHILSLNSEDHGKKISSKTVRYGDSDHSDLSAPQVVTLRDLIRSTSPW